MCQAVGRGLKKIALGTTVRGYLGWGEEPNKWMQAVEKQATCWLP